ncbi:MAG: CcmD family protein [Thermomicrobium sp.]|nr:CcmD family protein [Thermomicrobium sp.]MDW8058525.1 CcmD family protein [Thermomicrobium sp.]
MDSLWYLFAGFFVTWLILGVYLISLRRQVEVLRSELAALRGEQRRESVAADAPAARDSQAS